jgi:uncharacterized protein (DUF2267 family)
MTHHGALESAVETTNEWLSDIKESFGFDDDRAAYTALRATLHGLRDLLATDQAVRLGAELPVLVRGLYYEGWNPASAARPRPDNFLEAIRHELREHLELRDAERVARIVFAVIATRLAPGGIDTIIQSLPREIRMLWPQSSAEYV